MRVILAATAVVVAVVAGLSAQSREPSGILPRLTAEAHESAKACGKEGADCAIAPYEVCPAEAVRYSVRLATPFSRVAQAVLENLKSGRSGRGMDRGNANRWGTGVFVLPAEGSASAAGIEHVEIRRENLVVQPLTRTVGPIAVRMPDGSSRQLARGYFSFAPEVFAPSAPLTLVLKGTAGEITCLVDRARLQQLR